MSRSTAPDYAALSPRYYARDHYFDFIQFFADIPRDTRLLSAGCGSGVHLRLYPQGQGFDFNAKLERLWRDKGVWPRAHVRDIAEGLPYPDEHFDWSISTDFLEHLEPEQVSGVVDELVRLAPRGRHVIDTLKETVFRSRSGATLHPSANNREWWTREFERAGVQGLEVRQRGLHLFVSFGPQP